MTFTKKEFDSFTEENGTLRIVGHTKKKNHCTCFDGESADPECHLCFGTGWKYSWYLTRARRSQSGSSVSSSADKIDLSLPFDINTLNFKYYFKTECDVNSLDFIIEFMEPEGRRDYNLYLIKNEKIEEGEDGKIAYRTTAANKVETEEKIIKKALDVITAKQIEKV